ncbi:MAG TPA: hypothetical protein VF543_19395 [Pyrinomonadaceae bacterium]|jgi:hypothetical protein
MPNEEVPINWELTSARTDAIQYILAVVNCPQSVRRLINILVGVSEGRIEFETTRKEISSRIKGTVVDKAATDLVKSAHKQMKRWQEEKELNLVEYEPGYKEKQTGRLHKSRYYLHIFPLADKVIEYAQKEKLWASDRAQALEMAAEEYLSSFCPQAIMYHRSRSHKLSESKEIEKYVRTGITNLKKAMDILDKDKSTILLERSVIDELEQTLEELKNHLWYKNMIGEEG